MTTMPKSTKPMTVKDGRKAAQRVNALGQHGTGPESTIPVITDPAAVSQTLENLYWEMRGIEHDLWLTIGLARRAGFSWADVAVAMGMQSKQHAQQKFGRDVSETMERMDEEAEANRPTLDRVAKSMSIKRVAPRYVVEGYGGVEVSSHKSMEVAQRAAERERNRHGCEWYGEDGCESVHGNRRSKWCEGCTHRAAVVVIVVRGDGRRFLVDD